MVPNGRYFSVLVSLPCGSTMPGSKVSRLESDEQVTWSRH